MDLGKPGRHQLALLSRPQRGGTRAAIMKSNTLNESASGAYKVNSLFIDAGADPMDGTVTWDPARSIWNGGMLVAALVLGPIYFSWSAFLVFIVLLELTMCTGHSIGF